MLSPFQVRKKSGLTGAKPRPLVLFSFTVYFRLVGFWFKNSVSASNVKRILSMPMWHRLSFPLFTNFQSVVLLSSIICTLPRWCRSACERSGSMSVRLHCHVSKLVVSFSPLAGKAPEFFTGFSLALLLTLEFPSWLRRLPRPSSLIGTSL